MLAGLGNVKLKKRAPAEEAAPADGGNAAHLVGIQAGRSGLKKRAPVEDDRPPAEIDPAAAHLQAIQAAASRRKASMVTLGELESKPAVVSNLNPLAQEVSDFKLTEVESKFKQPEPAAPVAAAPPPPAAGAPPPAAPVSRPSKSKGPPPGPASAAVLASATRQIAPTVDDTGKPIPAWKQKILQKRLDADHQKVLDAKAAEVHKEARWKGIPGWKRAMIERKEAAALTGGAPDDGGAALAAAVAAPAAPAPAAKDGQLPAFKLKKTGSIAVKQPAPYKEPASARAAPAPYKAPAPAAAAPTGARFDPMTGKPLAQPAAPVPRFDPMTGQPLSAAAAAAPPPSAAPMTWKQKQDAKKAAAAPSAAPAVHPMVAQAAHAAAPAPVAAAAPTSAVPLAEWKTKLVQKRKMQNQKEIDALRAEKAAKEARWIGVPAWKRAIIEKKESQLAGL